MTIQPRRYTCDLCGCCGPNILAFFGVKNSGTLSTKIIHPDTAERHVCMTCVKQLRSDDPGWYKKLWKKRLGYTKGEK